MTKEEFIYLYGDTLKDVALMHTIRHTIGYDKKKNEELDLIEQVLLNNFRDSIRMWDVLEEAGTPVNTDVFQKCHDVYKEVFHELIEMNKE